MVSLLAAGGFLIFPATRFDVDVNATRSQIRGTDPRLLVATFAVHYTTFLTLAHSLLSLAPTPSGVGALESGVAGLVVRLASLAKEAATTLVLVDRLINHVSVILIGALIFALRQRRDAPPVCSPTRPTDKSIKEKDQ